MKKVGVVLRGRCKEFCSPWLIESPWWGGHKTLCHYRCERRSFGRCFVCGWNITLNILELGKANSLFGFSGLSLKKEGFFSMESIRKLIIENIPHNSFEKLKIRLFVNVTDFSHNKVIFFSEGKLMYCLIASASVPVLFIPVEYDHSLLVDGGLLNNFPAATIGFLWSHHRVACK